MKTLILLQALFISAISSASEVIKFHDGSNNTYIVVLISSKDIGEKQGLEVIANAATKKCGNKPVHLGEYRFQGQENISSNGGSGEESFRMVQQLFCGEVPAINQDLE